LTIPKLSIAAKLYVIFALMATTTVALSVVAVTNARTHVALTESYQAADTESAEVKRVNALIYAAFGNSRALLTAPDAATAARDATEMLAVSDQIGATTAGWKSNPALTGDSAALDAIVRRIQGYRDYLAQLAKVATESGPEAARNWAGTNSILDIRGGINADLEALGQRVTARADSIFKQLNDGIDRTALLLSLLAAAAVLLGAAGAIVIARSIVRPLADISRVTQTVAAGDAEIDIPFSERRDEIGAVARSIAVFQKAMLHNEDLNHTIREEASMRTRRQEQVAQEIARFSAEIEATLSELGLISDQMLGASSTLSIAADKASATTARAEEASGEASANVRDIASAADELSASVNEIDRQVAQSNAIATQAVNEAEATNIAVKELGEAAGRIGDVIKLITDIAEQTNLLALNATIEAARAGEAGRGFAVVAGEVKELAGQTQRATEEIGAQIAGMQRATSRSIEAITAIEQTIRSIGEISGAIAAAVTEQGAATQEIARSVDIAAKRTMETAHEVNLVGSATQDTRASANVVKGVSDELGSVAGRIRTQVDLFFDRLSA
jgi:methyl-accepting chemotaxis protein